MQMMRLRAQPATAIALLWADRSGGASGSSRSKAPAASAIISAHASAPEEA